MARVIAVTNQKGGVGKTTIACHLAMAAVERGQSVAVVDLDTQGHAGAVLSGDPTMPQQYEGGAHGLFESESPVFALTNSGVSLLHGHPWLSEIDMADGIMEHAVEMRARVRALPYDYVIVDTPPSIGVRQLAPLFWADVVVIPVEPASLSMAGLAAVMDTISQARHVNQGLVTRIVVNRYVPASKEQQRMKAELENYFPGLVIAEFRARVPVSDALARGQAVWKQRKDKQLGQDWLTFCELVLDTMK